jgi:predicted metal-binding membrane protein
MSSALTSPERHELGDAFAAARARRGVAAVVLVLAGLAWWATAERMAGMDAGPGTDLGTLGWFVGVWATMMAAMMLPSLAPTAALYAQLAGRRDPVRPALFVAGYLWVWSAAGVCAYGLFELGKSLLGRQLAWHAGGQLLAGGVLALAAAYQLTPAKRSCLQRCRRPHSFLRGAWREGRSGALALGARNGLVCLGCCWALMAALFALGVMSLTWMAVVAALVALEKVAPRRGAVVTATTLVLLALTSAILIAPRDVPGLVVPGARDATGAMHMAG